MTGANHWKLEEKEKLVSLCKKFGRDWEAISKELPHRTAIGCRQQASKIIPDFYHSIAMPRYPWTPIENRLLSALQEKGTPTSEMSSYFHDRSDKACLYKCTDGHNVPQQKIIQIQWTKQEDKKLVELREANKSWYEIHEALDKVHSHWDCRARWIETFWVAYNNSIVNDQIDLEKLREGVRNEKAKLGAVDETDNGEADAEGDSDYGEGCYDGEADADGDSGSGDGEADADGDSDSGDGEADADDDSDYVE